jgi:hypothetical protein
MRYTCGLCIFARHSRCAPHFWYLLWPGSHCCGLGRIAAITSCNRSLESGARGVQTGLYQTVNGLQNGTERDGTERWLRSNDRLVCFVEYLPYLWAKVHENWVTRKPLLRAIHRTNLRLLTKKYWGQGSRSSSSLHRVRF